MKVAVFSTKSYDSRFFQQMNADFGHELQFLEARLTIETVPLASGFRGICAFVNDVLDAAVLEGLHKNGVRLIALRSAGFNNVDLSKAHELGLAVVRVPAYSPFAVAEHTMGLILTLNRKLHRAIARVREANFSLEGLLGFDLHERTAGIVGTGKIGKRVAHILAGCGCRLLGYDVQPNDECRSLGVAYVELDDLYSRCDIITLHCPLSPETYHLIDSRAIDHMKDGTMLINTSRGAIIDTTAVIDGLKSGRIGSLGIDVYEEEGDLFFEDLSNQVIQDDVFARLLTFPNVVVTGHQAFFTTEALQAIAKTTLSNISDVEQGRECANRLTAEMLVKQKS